MREEETTRLIFYIKEHCDGYNSILTKIAFNGVNYAIANIQNEKKYIFFKESHAHIRNILCEQDVTNSYRDGEFIVVVVRK